jgi:hypothetical protein
MGVWWDFMPCQCQAKDIPAETKALVGAGFWLLSDVPTGV